MKNHKLAQAIQDCSWSKFNQLLEYKAEWNGVNIIRIGRFEPSSKKCSVCGHIKNDLELKDRMWTCSKCSTQHDRDLNAAQNILQVGLKEQLFLIGASPHQSNRVGVEHPESKPLENTLSERGSVKEETKGL